MHEGLAWISLIEQRSPRSETESRGSPKSEVHVRIVARAPTTTQHALLVKAESCEFAKLVSQVRSLERALLAHKQTHVPVFWERH